jgi:hypothetical protein
MDENTVAYLRNSLNEILEIDPKAIYEFEDCGSGTNVLNIYLSDKSAKKLTMKDLDRLENDFDLCGDEEGETVKERLMRNTGKNTLFICLS